MEALFLVDSLCDVCSLVDEYEVSFVVFTSETFRAFTRGKIITDVLRTQFCVISDTTLSRLTRNYDYDGDIWNGALPWWIEHFLSFVRKFGLLPVRESHVEAFFGKAITIDELEVAGVTFMTEFIRILECFKRKIPEYSLSIYSRLEERSTTNGDEKDGYKGLTIAKKAVGPATEAGMFLPALPPELRIMVMRYLDIRSLGRLAMVSRHAYQESSDYVLWRPFLNDRIESDIERSHEPRETIRMTAIFHSLRDEHRCHMCGYYMYKDFSRYYSGVRQCLRRCEYWSMPSNLKQQLGITIKQTVNCDRYQDFGTMEPLIHLAISMHGGSLETLNAYLVKQYEKAVKRVVYAWKRRRKKKKRVYEAYSTQVAKKRNWDKLAKPFVEFLSSSSKADAQNWKILEEMMSILIE